MLKRYWFSTAWLFILILSVSPVDASQNGEKRCWVEEDIPNNFILSLRARLNKGKGYAIWFRTEPGKMNGYCFQYDTAHAGGSLILSRWQNCQQQFITSAARNWEWYGQMRNVVIKAAGPDISITIDDEEIVCVKDEQFYSGKTGFRLWDYSEADFEDITFTSIDE